MPLEEVEITIDKDVYLPCYQHLLDGDDIDIELVWGGRDSGKSHAIGQISVEQCLSLDYFRCILVKETHEAIKDSQVEMITEIVEDWGVEEIFEFIKSPLEIRCGNRNKFIARGTDKPKKLRSITNPSHVWGEEGNQLSEVAFITILTSLRNKYGKVKFYLTFNPEADCSDFNDHWLFKTFFAKHYPHTLNFTAELKIDIPGNDPVVLKYRSTHTTYHDNPYVSPQRKAFHEALKVMNYHWYQVFTLGLWGNQENDCPWLFAFDRQKHISPVELFAKQSETLYLSFDFNRNPQACTVIQWDEIKQIVYVIEVIKIPNIGTEGICEIVMQKYPGFLYVVTGDYSGDTVSSLFKEQVTNYTIIKNILRLNDGQVRISPNPPLAKNQTLVNAVFFGYTILACPVKAKPFIYDAEKVKKRADGTIVKDNRNDPAQQADVLDTVRYWINQFMAWFVKNGTDQKPVENNKLKLTIQKVLEEPVNNAITKALAAIERGEQAMCTRTDYPKMRNAILDQAAKWIDENDTARAVIALNEVKRLDSLFSE